MWGVFSKQSIPHGTVLQAFRHVILPFGLPRSRRFACCNSHASHVWNRRSSRHFRHGLEMGTVSKRTLHRRPASSGSRRRRIRKVFRTRPRTCTGICIDTLPGTQTRTSTFNRTGICIRTLPGTHTRTSVGTQPSRTRNRKGIRISTLAGTQTRTPTRLCTRMRAARPTCTNRISPSAACRPGAAFKECLYLRTGTRQLPSNLAVRLGGLGLEHCMETSPEVGMGCPIDDASGRRGARPGRDRAGHGRGWGCDGPGEDGLCHPPTTKEITFPC